jgi:tetratricopeptide (TPR) repeat protein
MKNYLGYIIITFLLFSISVNAQQGNTDYQYALIEAVKQKNLGNLPGAMELYKLVLEENDSVAVAHYEIGTLYAVTGNLDKGRFHLERANELSPDIHWYFESYIDVLLAEEEYRIAEKALRKKIKQDKENIDHHYKLANVYYLAEKSKRAIRVLVNMENRWGFSDKITLLKAKIYESNGNFDKALNEVKKVIQIFPESIELKVVAAELALKSKDEDLAAEYYKGVFEVDSTNIYALTNLTDYFREKNELSKSFYYLQKSFESDEIDFERKLAILGFYISDQKIVEEQEQPIQKLVDTMLEKYWGRQEIHLLATDYFINRVNYDQALNAIKPLLNRSEKRYGFWKQGLLLANVTGRNTDMKDIAENAFELFPDSVEIVYFKGIAEYELQQYEELLKTFSKKRIFTTKDPEIRTQMKMLVAESYYELKQYDLSDSIFRAIIKEDNENYIVMNNFSYYLSERGESLDEAKELSRIVIENNPENDTFLDTYAWILYQREEYDEAEIYIMKALKHGGEDSAVINEHAGDIHKKIGSISLARDFYQKAIILGGKKEDLIRKLEKLNGVYEE